jgi:predicted dehydrogenase
VPAKKIGVGIIGASAERAWGSRAHIPAIKASPDFVLRAVSTSRRESAEQASATFGVPGYDDHHALIAQPDIDLVVVAVKVSIPLFKQRCGSRILRLPREFCCFFERTV